MREGMHEQNDWRELNEITPVVLLSPGLNERKNESTGRMEIGTAYPQIYDFSRKEGNR